LSVGDLFILLWFLWISNSSWQILTFSPRIVVFIRICGTHNTANEVFHCVHFECPCQADILKSYINEQAEILTTDEKEDNCINYEEFSKHYKTLFDNSFSLIDNSSLIQTHMILPYVIKPNSTVIFHT
jgi:hypothetical protein